MSDWTSSPDPDGSSLGNTPMRPTGGRPAGVGTFRSPQVLGVCAMVGIGVVMIVNVLGMLQTVHLSRLVGDYVSTSGSLNAIDTADRQRTLISACGVLATVATAVVFICWMWRARRNAEFFTDAQHRRKVGWVIGGWFCPIVNLWFPCQIVNDIQAASDPRTAPTGDWLQRTRGGNLVIWWWITLLAGGVLGRVAFSRISDASTLQTLQSALSFSIVSDLVSLVAGFFALGVIMGITRLQLSRPPIPWWSDPQAHHLPWPQDPFWPDAPPPSQAAPWAQNPPPPPADNRPRPENPPQSRPPGNPSWPQTPPPARPSDDPSWPEFPPGPGERR